MEVPRTMLALKGVEYDDGRYTTDPPYDNVKSRDEIAQKLGYPQIPGPGAYTLRDDRV